MFEGLDQLRQHTALGALLDSTERFDPPKCAPDTRVAIINEILEWMSNADEESSVMWLYGPAGAGKSALSQTLAEMNQDQKRLLASFFFSRTAANRSDGRLLISTLSYQLMLSLPATRRFIKDAIEADPVIFDRSIETQMEKLFIGPINKSALSWSYLLSEWVRKHFGCFAVHHPRVVIVDGLDECQNPRVQADLLRIIGESTEYLKLPIKFLISSRPESHIVRVFNHDSIFQKLSIATINLAMDNTAHHDIKTFLQNEFSEIKRTHPLNSYLHSSWPSPDAIRQLVRKASGQFIYASTVIKYIQSPKHRPDDRLNVILGLSVAPTNESPFSELDALYTHIFSSVENIGTVMMIFGVLIITRNKGDGLGNYTNPEMLEKLLFLRPGDVVLLLGDLLSLVSLGGRNSPIKIMHASLADYLLNPIRSRRFCIDLGITHSFLARGYLHRVSKITSTLNFNPSDLLASVTPFVSHCSRAVLTQELYDTLLKFDFVAIFKTLLTRHRSWLILNPYYLWFFIASIIQILASEALRGSKPIRVLYTEQFDHLNDYLVLQLKSTVPETYLADVISSITMNDFRRNLIPLIKSSKPSQYLTLLCQLFYWDYNTSFTSKITLRYTLAVKQCLRYVEGDTSEEMENSHLKRLYRQFPGASPDKNHLEEAHLDCAIALLPHAAYDYEFVEYAASYRFSDYVLTCYHDKVEILKEVMANYFMVCDQF
uniref:Nephrocystin 3-like N-terminal domain-containing protein n=1 Tax=Psilocybe cubensis TaxID=181762 RepID=A0A8H7XLX0_PSICU